MQLSQNNDNGYIKSVMLEAVVFEFLHFCIPP